MKRTELEWDKYIDYLIEAIDESKFMKRAENKPMQTSKHDLEAHLSSRASHVREVANIAKRIAEGLGLNAKYIYAGMLMHDAGHPFSAHDGEEIFTGIGELYNCQYFHHNAKGVEVVKSEDICEKAITKIPNIKNKPELRKKLEEEFPFFLDIIISHDGEAGPKDMNKAETDYASLNEAVQEKLLLANSKNNYKFIAQTTEGKIAKFADVIAYLSSDLEDRFRLGIHKNFDDDYLELFGEMFAKDYVETKEEKIQIAKNIIDEIKEEKLRELLVDAKAEENKEIIAVANKITSDITNLEINFETAPEEAEEIMEKYIDEYKKKNSFETLTDEEKKFLNSDAQRIREFVGKKLRVRSTVVAEITTRMQEYFINDLLKNSRSSDTLQFSDIGKDLFFKAKQINYKYVPETKWEYQREAQPKAVQELIETLARSLIKSGAIANKFYDRSMRKHVKDEKALQYLKTSEYVDESKYKKYKKETDIRDIKVYNRKYTTEGSAQESKAKKELFANAYDYVQNEGVTFATKYINTFYAIEDQIRNKVKNVTGRSSESEAKGRIVHIDYLDKKIKEDEEKIREYIENKYGTENLTDEQFNEIVMELTHQERLKMEEKMAMQLAIDYLAGMTDKGINEMLVQTGYMENEVIAKSKRGTSDQDKEKFSNLQQNMQEPNDIDEELGL